MGQLLRQIGVVIGLTVILTFPVTVASGAGSQKQSDHLTRVVAVTGGMEQVLTFSLDEVVKHATTHSQH
jgi:hypothetical protein